MTDHCLRSRNYVNVIVAGKQPSPQWLGMEAAIQHCAAGIGIWHWAGSDEGGEPGVVMACCGDVPTLEALAAVDLLRTHFPELKVRVVNVVDLMKLQSQGDHPHGLGDAEFDRLFTVDNRSFSPIMAIPRSSTGSPIAAPTTEIFMCMATRKKAQRARRSTRW